MLVNSWIGSGYPCLSLLLTNVRYPTMDIKTSTKACEGFILSYVNSATSAATAMTDAIVAVFDHVHSFDECSLADQLHDKVKVYGSSKQVSAFNMLRRLAIPFSEKTGKKVEPAKVEQCKANWAKFKAELTGDAAISITEWYDDMKGKSTDKDSSTAKAEKEAAKRQKIFNEVQAERRLSDPVAAKVAEYEAQLRAAYEANPSQAMAMAEADINQLRNSIAGKIADALAAA